MSQPKNVMEIFKLLEKSNCRECGFKTCLAFAGAVFKGEKDLSECPRLDKEIIKGFSKEADHNDIDENRAEYIEMMKKEIAGIDLEERAGKIGARFSDKKLIIRVLGKEFFITSKGDVSSDIHINPWVVLPLLNYVLYAKGTDISGKWVSFRELKEGKERYPLFQKRCEESMKRVADIYTELFNDIVHLFNGREVEKEFESDISVVLHPLPKVPIMICYWEPEDGLESKLNIFFDKTAEDNLDNGSIFTLGAGLAQMFEKLSLRHGFSV